MSSSEDEAIRRPGRQRGSDHDSPNGALSDAEQQNGPQDDDDEDLFGSGSEPDGETKNEDVGQSRPRRTLDDEELDSGDDEGRTDRLGEPMELEEEDAAYEEEVKVMDINLGRAPAPLQSNDEIYTMNIPSFLSLETEEFRPETYVPPPFSTAATSLCWRRDPNDPSKLQSNARIIQWEDGSLTLQLASNPKEQYRIVKKPLAPPNKSGGYDPTLDTHTYLAAAAETASVFRITSHLTQGLTVLPAGNETDDAVQKLQESLAAASRGSRGPSSKPGIAIIEVKEDPELASKRAEAAEREKLRADRRRQALAERENVRAAGRRAPYRPSGGLTVGDLEDEDGMAATPARPSKRARANRRGEIYSDDEDEYDRRTGRGRANEYDEDDGFLARDSEEESVASESESEEVLADEDMDAEGEIDEEVSPPERSAPAAQRSETPRRAGTPAETAARPEPSGSPSVRKKPRYVVEDDDDE